MMGVLELLIRLDELGVSDVQRNGRRIELCYCTCNDPRCVKARTKHHVPRKVHRALEGEPGRRLLPMLRTEEKQVPYSVKGLVP